MYRSALLTDNLYFHSTKSEIDTNGIMMEKGYNKHEEILATLKKENPPNQQDPTICIQYLSGMAALCEQHNVRFIVVTPPFSDLYIHDVSPEGIKRLDSIAAVVNMNHHMEYHNYMCDSAFRNDSLYYNWNHLNHLGATLFAQRVKDDFGL